MNYIASLFAACAASASPVLAQLAPEALVQSPAAAAADYFGHSVALDGDTLAVGSTMAGPLISTGPGRVEVYRGAGPGWVLEAVLEPASGQVGDHFGHSVAVHGGTLVVGAPYADVQGGTSGAAYVYVRSEGQWELQQQLLPSEVRSGSLLGASVALEGDRLLLGARGGVGQAYVFERHGGSWTESQRLEPIGLQDPDHFGSAVALDGDRAVVTAPNHGAGGHNGGGLFLFERTVLGWAEGQRLLGPAGAQVGRRVAFSGSWLASPRFDGGAGELFTWHHGPSGWALDEVLVNPRHLPIEGCALGSNRLLVADQGGHVRLLERTGGGWTEGATLEGLPASSSDFNSWIDMDGEQVVVGARDLSTAASQAGGAFVFHLSGRSVEIFCESAPGTSGRTAGLGVLGRLSVQADDLELLVLGATPHSVALMTYGRGAARLPLGDGVLCIDPFQGIYRLAPRPLDGHGHLRMPVELAALEGGGGVTAGTSRVFQAWYRDAGGGGAQFNLTNALRVVFAP